MSEFPESDVYAQLARLGKALSSPVRLRLLDLLEAGERDVETLSATAGVPLKNTSAQLQQLRAANLVATRRNGNRIFYRLVGAEVSTFLGHFQELAESRLADLRDAVVDLLGEPEALDQVSADELSDRLHGSGTVVVDVRDRSDYERSHLPDAISIPVEELDDRLPELPTSVDIVAYCQGPYCVLSPRAVRIMRANGFAAYTLDGGLTRWQRAGRDVQPGPSRRTS